MVDTKKSTKVNDYGSISFCQSSFSAITKKVALIVSKQKKIDLSFKWHVYADSSYTDESLKMGLEFRDMYGRLIFALLNHGGSHVCYATTGLDSDSSVVNNKFEPCWRKVPAQDLNNYSCQVHLLLDFTDGEHGLSVEVSDTKDNQLFKLKNELINGKNLSKIVGVNYSAKEFPISHNIFEMSFKNLDDQIEMPLAGKSVYAFGDSIVNGHLYAKKGFVDFLAQQEGMNLKKYAVNGGTILPGESSVLQQVIEATVQAPDFMIFNGGTNDAFERNEKMFGEITPGNLIGPFDMETYAGRFEEIIRVAKQKWPNTKIVFVAIPKICSRNIQVQTKLHAIQQAACEKWQIGFLDMYSNSKLDTTNDIMRKNYTFDNLGSDGFPGTIKTAKSDEKTPSGTHPNFSAIQEFYVPELLEYLKKL